MLWYIALIVLALVGFGLFQRYQERELERKIDKAGNNPDLILSEMDAAIEQDRKITEALKNTGGKGLF